MSLTLTERSVRMIVTKVIDKKYGITVNDVIRLLKEGTLEDPGLKMLLERLPEWQSGVASPHPAD